MKQLVCEMCGSTDLMKQDGVFVCQSCGTKYSVEEAKKMMIDVPAGDSSFAGTVATTKKDEKTHKQAEQAEKESDGHSHKEDVGDASPTAEEQGREEGARIAKRIKIIAISVICAIITVVIVLNAIVIPTIRRNALVEKYGVDLIGKYGEDLIAKHGEDFVAWFESLKIGDIFTFGSYEQDDYTLNGEEKIEWLILDKQDSRALIISKKALDYKPYNTSNSDITWETCSLRRWLNNDFINAVFSEGEKALIPTVTVSADRNPDYDTDPGNATQDRVFLLSITEVNDYFSNEHARQCKPSDYAVACGAYPDRYNGNCSWWLRSPGWRQSVPIYIDELGFDEECRSDYRKAIRPALWIDLNA